MKVLALSLLVALSSVSSAAADSASVKQTADQSPVSVPKLPEGFSSTVSAQLDALDVARGDRVSFLQAIFELQNTIAGLPTASELRLRFEPILQHLYDRALSTYIYQEELADLRQAYVNARIDRALTYLEERAEGAGWTRAQYLEVSTSWLARADAFVDAPDPVAYRARIKASLELAFQRADELLESVRQMRIELLRLHVEASRSRVNQAVALGRISESDAWDVVGSVIERARWIFLNELQR
ncbi:MAG: hypothetical protein AAGG01_04625 [Planctomycetota bacterium]